MLKMHLHVQASMLCITGYYEMFGNFEPKITIKLSKKIYNFHFPKKPMYVILRVPKIYGPK